MNLPGMLSKDSLRSLLPALKTRAVSGALAVGVHLLLLFLLVYVVHESSSPGLPEQSVDVSLSLTPALAKAEQVIQPKLVTLNQTIVNVPPLDVAPDPSVLRAMPIVSASNASRGDSQYLVRLWLYVLQNMRFPRNALLSGISGVVMVHVVIDRDGFAHLVEIEESSGSAELDAAALDVINRSQPLPPLPDNFGSDYFSTVIRLGYGRGADSAAR